MSRDVPIPQACRVGPFHHQVLNTALYADAMNATINVRGFHLEPLYAARWALVQSLSMHVEAHR